MAEEKKPLSRSEREAVIAAVEAGDEIESNIPPEIPPLNAVAPAEDNE